MKRSSYRDRDYAFGQTMLTLRATIGLTQTGLADTLGVSRRTVGEWEAGGKYPKVEHLKALIAFAVQHGAFTAGREAEEIRALWKASRQKVLLDENWIATLLASQGSTEKHDFPPAPASAMKGIRNVVTRLPFQMTAFVGRADELSEITGLLRNPACRLLTLLGPGGIGKTRLALEVAAQQADAFSDGVAFVSLASISNTNQIASAIGKSLQLSFAGQTDLTDYLLKTLHDLHLLLVLDNFEHVLDGVDLVYEILQAAANVTLLVTSRVRLNLQAEWLFDVEGLAFPVYGASDISAPRTMKEFSNYSAVDLFVQRANQIQPGFPLSEAGLKSIASICQQVAGMPLAIELAAAGVRILPLSQMEQRIRSNMDVLATTFRDLPARHRSMRAVFEHSWELLAETERALLSHLAVFRGSFGASAAEAVTGAAFTALTTLVDKSLLRQVTTESILTNALETKTEARFFLLLPIREYALEKLVARGETEALQSAHANFYLALVESFMSQWGSPTAIPVIDQINRELNNIRAALQWARDTGDATLGLQLAGILWRFWRSAGYISEARAWLEELLALEDLPSGSADLSARLLAMHAAAWMASDQQDFVRATQLFDQSVPIRRALGGTEVETHMLHNEALQARAIGQYHQATALLEDALARNRALSSGGLGQSLYEMGFSLYGLALMFREQGEFERAAALFQECIDFHHDTGDREGVAQGLLGLGDVARDRGDIAATREYTEQSLAIYRETRTQWAIGFALNNLAQAAYAAGDLSQAFALVSESISLFREQQADASLAEVLVTLGHILRAQGDISGAYDALMESLRLVWIHGPRLLLATTLEGIAVVLSQREQAADAIQIFSVASELRRHMGTPIRPADQPAVEQALTVSRSVLGTTTFDALWAQGRELTLEQILNAIDPEIFDDVIQQPVTATSPVEAQVEPPARVTPQPRVDWDDALSVPVFYGREREQALLTEWLIEDRCRVVSLLGLGGIGKSSLAITLMHKLAPQFEIVIWRSLRDIPMCDVLLDDLLQLLAPEVLREVPAVFERRLGAVLDHMRRTRILLVLDNVESVLEEGAGRGRVRPGYEGFGRFLRQSAETAHQSCLLITSREKPSDLISQEGNRSPVRVLRLARLDAEACDDLLTEKEVIGTPAERVRLIEAYAGNPLALKIVSQTLVDLFDGEIAPFLEQGEVIFGGVRELLNQHYDRLSELEQTLLFWLAIMREPVTIEALRALLVFPLPSGSVLEAIDGLWRRSLIERGHARGSFTLQSVVLDYMTVRLIAEASDEILQGKLARLIQLGLEQAPSKDYVREVQERLLVLPLLASLQTGLRAQSEFEAKMAVLLDNMRTLDEDAQGYGPANLVTLLRAQRGNLRGVNLSHLALRSVSLQGVEMQDASLAGAIIRGSIFTETVDAIKAVAISSSGVYWAGSSRRGEVWLWEAGGLTLRRVWIAHGDTVPALAFSPDERFLATCGGWDCTVKLWDVVNGSLLWTGRHTSHVNGVAFSPDGGLLATSGNDAVVRLWDVNSGAQLQALSHSAPVTGLTWNQDGNLLASGDAEGYIWLWEMHEIGQASCLYTFAGHPKWVEGLSFSPDGNTLATAGWDRAVKLWNVSSGSLRQTLDGHTDRVYRVAWSPDGTTLASGSRDKSLWLWDVELNKYRVALQGHTAGVNGLGFTVDSSSLLSASDDGTLRLWDVTSGQCVRIIQGYANSLYDVDWSPNGEYLASGGTDALVTIWDVSGRIPARTLRGHSRVVSTVAWGPDGKTLASSEWDHEIRLWDPTSGVDLGVLQYPDDLNNFFFSFAWSPDGARIASGTYRQGLQIIETTTHDYPWLGRPFSVWIHSVAWSPNGTWLAGGGDDGTVYIWDAADGRLLQRMTGHEGIVNSVVWSPNGKLLASGGGSSLRGELFLWNPQRGERVGSFGEHSGIVSGVSWGGSEETLISGDGVGKLRWWDVSSRECIVVREAHNGTVQALKRSPDGHKLASCGDDGAIMLWDLESGQHMQTLRHDRPYERLNITGIGGLTEAQKLSLRSLGAVDDAL